MNILIIGHKDFIGKNLSKYLKTNKKFKFQYQEFTKAKNSKSKSNVIPNYKFISPFDYIDQIN